MTPLNAPDRDKPLCEEGYALMAAAFEVHRVLSGGLSEEIYQQSLEHELGLRKIPYTSKEPLAVIYKERRFAVTYIPDLVVFGQIIVELKAVRELTAEHEAPLINYSRICRRPVGYLINFGPIGKNKVAAVRVDGPLDPLAFFSVDQRSSPLILDTAADRD